MSSCILNMNPIINPRNFLDKGCTEKDKYKEAELEALRSRFPLNIDPATGELDIGSWYITYLPTNPTHPTPPRTLPSWIIKANPSCSFIMLS